MQKLIDKARVLIEALPYISDFRGRTVVVKVGGAALENVELRRRFAEDVTLLDWVGINYYTRGLYKYDASRAGIPITQVKGDLEKNDLGWEIYPQGLTDLLVRVSTEYTKLPIYVTENGMSENDDARRVAFYDAHLKAVRAAQEKGADVRGYFAWSLLDNFEWAHGYSKRFGLVHVDFETQKRTPKDSAHFYAQVIASRGRVLDEATDSDRAPAGTHRRGGRAKA